MDINNKIEDVTVIRKTKAGTEDVTMIRKNTIENEDVTTVRRDGGGADDVTMIRNTPQEETSENIAGIYELKAGDVVDGFRIGEPISLSGGEADVRFAHKDNKIYAIKIYRGNREVNENMRKKMQAISSPYVAKVLHSATTHGVYFEIFDYYKNKTLKDQLAWIKQNPDFIKNSVVEQLNEGLKAIHDQGIVHGDFKPENIFLSDDRKTVLIGDFGISNSLNDRTSVTNINGAITSSYAAPEADEVTNIEGDYFSFGMTLLTLSLGKHVFDGMSPKRIRKMILQGELIIPEEVDSDLADLIYKLTEVAAKKRIGYDGVKNWLANKKIYAGCREEGRSAGSVSDVSIEKYSFKVGKGVKYFYNLRELTEVMNDNFAEAKKHFDNDLLSQRLRMVDAQLSITCSDIYNRYQNDPDAGVLLTLHTLNEDLVWKYADHEFASFADLIKFCEDAGGSWSVVDKLKPLFNKEVMRLWLSNEGKDDLANVVESIFGEDDTIKDVYRYDLFLNTFKSRPNFYFLDSSYETLADFVEERLIVDLYNEKNILICDEASDGFLRYKDAYAEIFVKQYGLDREEIKKIFAISDDVLFLLTLGKFLSGSLPIFIPYSGSTEEAHDKCEHIRDFRDFIDWVNGYFEQDAPFVDNALEGNLYHYLINVDKSAPKQLIQQLKGVKTPVEKRAILYYNTQNDKVFMNCNSVEELIAYVSESDDIVALSKRILGDLKFDIWIKSLGYKI